MYLHLNTSAFSRNVGQKKYSVFACRGARVDLLRNLMVYPLFAHCRPADLQILRDVRMVFVANIRGSRLKRNASVLVGGHVSYLISDSIRNSTQQILRTR